MIELNWKIIPDFSNYAINQKGEVINISRNKIIISEAITLRNNKTNKKTSRKVISFELFGKKSEIQDLPNETWCLIDNLDHYYISNLGRIKVENHIYLNGGKKYLCKEKILKTQKNKKGYSVISLAKSTTYCTRLVHRVVAIAFIPNPENKPQVNHINSNKSDNSVQNLEWCTNDENLDHLIYMRNIRKEDLDFILNKISNSFGISTSDLYNSIISTI